MSQYSIQLLGILPKLILFSKNGVHKFAFSLTVKRWYPPSLLFTWISFLGISLLIQRSMNPKDNLSHFHTVYHNRTERRIF